MSTGLIRNRAFDISWVIFLMAQFISKTSWYALYDDPVKIVCYKVLTYISCALCIFVIITGMVKKVYRSRVIVLMAALAVIFALSWYFSKNNMLIWSFLLLAAAYGQDSRRVIRLSLIITGAALCIIVLLSLVIPSADFVIEDAGRVRHFLGFNWATNAPTLLFFFALQYIFIRKEKMHFLEYLILEAVNVFFFIMTDTNFPFALLTCVLLFFFVEGLFKNHWKILSRPEVLYYILPLAICIITVLACILFNPETGFLDRLNVLLNHRLGFGRQALMQFGVTPFGREIAWIGNSITGIDGVYNYVDCSYMQILLNQGVVFLITVIGIYTAMAVKAVKARDYWLVFAGIAVLLHSITEPRLFDLSYNVIPILAFLRLERVEDNVSLDSLVSTDLKLKFTLRNILWRIRSILGMNRHIEKAFIKTEDEISNIPVFIISFNRLSYLQSMIASLKKVGISNIHIIDNASTYPPLLDYYKNIPYDVIYMDKNYGSRVFWESDVFDRYRNDFYIVSDSDLELLDECPQNVIYTLFKTLGKYPFVRKVGLSLMIEDVPDTEIGKEAKKWEGQFFRAPIKGAHAYYASVDTTFAVYLPDDLASGVPFLRAIRCDRPYMARHLPWYRSQEELTEEDEYYFTHRSNGWWDAANGEVTPD